MSETLLFIAGIIVTSVAGTGVFLYAMFSFGRWSDRMQSDGNDPQ